jgi:hypothetical protein
MITVICGEDLVASRNYYFDLKNKYREKNYEIKEINANQIEEVQKGLGESISLFSDKIIFFTQNVNKVLNRKNSSMNRFIENLQKNKNIEIIDWEEGIGARNLKFPKTVIIKDFKPSQTIFKLLDSCYTTNKKNFVNQINSLPDKVEEGFIFYMLTRHIKTLLLIKSGEKPAGMFDWQLYKLKKQASFWSLEKLILFYENLHKIDVINKTSKNPFSIRSSLDLLAYYLL